MKNIVIAGRDLLVSGLIFAAGLDWRQTARFGGMC